MEMAGGEREAARRTKRDLTVFTNARIAGGHYIGVVRQTSLPAYHLVAFTHRTRGVMAVPRRRGPVRARADEKAPSMLVGADVCRTNRARLAVDVLGAGELIGVAHVARR